MNHFVYSVEKERARERAFIAFTFIFCKRHSLILNINVNDIHIFKELGWLLGRLKEITFFKFIFNIIIYHIDILSTCGNEKCILLYYVILKIGFLKAYNIFKKNIVRTILLFNMNESIVMKIINNSL